MANKNPKSKSKPTLKPINSAPAFLRQPEFIRVGKLNVRTQAVTNYYSVGATVYLNLVYKECTVDTTFKTQVEADAVIAALHKVFETEALKV